MRKKKRVVITGMGLVSCFGSEIDSFYQALLEGKSGIRRIRGFPCEEYPTQIAAEVSDFDPGDFIEKKQARRIDKSIAYALVAGKKAFHHALLSDSVAKERCGVLMGSGIGGMAVFSEGVETLVTKGPRRISPFFIPYILTNMAGALLGIDLGWMGPNYSISTACATGNYALIAAAKHIQSGEADVMIAGGTEAPILPAGLGGFCACKALSQRNEAPESASRPFDTARDGFVMGEGAGALVLESLDHALARKAPILAEWLGGGISTDAYHMTEPRADGVGVQLCITRALQEAGLAPHQVDYINAHATSTPLGDRAEIHALQKIFSKPERIYMNATKSMIGHLLGAAGAVEAIVCVKALQEQKIHPTCNLENKEPGLLFQVPTEATVLPIQVALSNSFGFGGHNASILLGRLSESA